MTKAQAAQKALDRWVNILALGHWEIDLVLVDAEYVDADANSADFGVIGKVDRHFPSLSATVTVASKQPAQDIAETIRHELLHLVMTELGVVAYALANYRGDEGRHAAKEDIAIAEEHAVRTLERAYDRLGVPA